MISDEQLVNLNAAIQNGMCNETLDEYMVVAIQEAHKFLCESRAQRNNQPLSGDAWKDKLTEKMKDAAQVLPGFNDEMVRLSDALAIVRNHRPDETAPLCRGDCREAFEEWWENKFIDYKHTNVKYTRCYISRTQLKSGGLMIGPELCGKTD